MTGGPRTATPAAPAGIVAVCALIASAAGCGPTEEIVEAEATLWQAPEGPALDRRVLAAEWDTLWRVGGTLEDTTFLGAVQVTAGRRHVYVLDGYRQSLLAFDFDGRLAWTAGRPGSGPRELRDVRDVELGPGGEIYLLDAGNDRVVRVTPDGGITGSFPLSAVPWRAEQFTVREDGGVWLATMHGDSTLVAVDRSGAPVDVQPVPWEGFPRLHRLARQGVTAADPGTGRWIYGFMLGDGWFPYRRGRPLSYRGRYAEHQPFPRIRIRRDGDRVSTRLVGYNPCTACDAEVRDGRLFVLFGGRTELARRVVDAYEWGDGSYAGSYVFPERIQHFALARPPPPEEGGEIFFALDPDPVPALLALRPGAAPGS